MTPDQEAKYVIPKMTIRAGLARLHPAAEARLRQRIIAQALSWVGTPYRQLGATKGVSVDCSMLLVRVFIDAGVVEEFDPRPYPPTWFLHQGDERYIDWLSAAATEVETPQPGDILTYRFGRAFSHSGIMIDADHLVHAFADEQQCLVSPLFHSTLRFADRSGLTPRPRRCFDVLARLRVAESAV